MTGQIDIENHSQLIDYLRAGDHVTPADPPHIYTLAGGVSNRTVLVKWPNGRAWVMKQALAKLRVQADWFSDPARIHREALGLRWCGQLLPAGRVPALIFEDETNHVLAMSAVPEPHDNWKTQLLCGDVQPQHVAQFADMLGTVHCHAFEQRATLEPILADRSFFESLRLEPYYEFTAVRVPQAAPFLRALVDNTRATRQTVVHGDYSPKNVLVHAGQLVLLDFEVIHWGDPAFDLGFALTHFLSKAHHVAGKRGAFLQAAQMFWHGYCARVDGLFDGVEERAVRHTLACLLARVDGRSPLEYLTPTERDVQRTTVLQLMAAPPPTVRALIEAFAALLPG